MRASLLLVLIGVGAASASCGGKVVFDQGAGGSSSSSHASAVVSSSATNAVVGSGVTSSSSVAPDICDALTAAVSSAIIAAQACSACQNSQPCVAMVFSPSCGCAVAVDSQNTDAIAQVTSALQDLQSAGCVMPCPDCPAVPPNSLFCLGNGNGCDGSCQVVFPD